MIAVTVRVSGAIVVESAGIESSSSTFPGFTASVPKLTAALWVLLEADAGSVNAAGLRLAS